MTGDADRSEVGYDVTWTGSPADGNDPLQTFAMTVLAAHKQARSVGGQAMVSRVRIAETDGAGRATLITAHLRLQAAGAQALQEAADTIRRQALERAARDGTRMQIVAHAEQ